MMYYKNLIYFFVHSILFIFVSKLTQVSKIQCCLSEQKIRYSTLNSYLIHILRTTIIPMPKNILKKSELSSHRPTDENILFVLITHLTQEMSAYISLAFASRYLLPKMVILFPSSTHLYLMTICREQFFPGFYSLVCSGTNNPSPLSNCPLHQKFSTEPEVGQSLHSNPAKPLTAPVSAHSST